MAKFTLVDTNTLIPEGMTTFKITEASYDEDYGRMVITMQTKSGQRHFERFGMIDQNGEINDGALKAFSALAKNALNNFENQTIDEQELVGHYIKAMVMHEDYDYTNRNGEHKTGTSVRLGKYQPADGFETDTVSEEPEDDSADDMDSWLDD